MSTRFSGGGVVAEIFRDLQKPMRFRIFLFRGLKTTFFVNGALLHFFTFPKGGPGPPGPPLDRPLNNMLFNINATRAFIPCFFTILNLLDQKEFRIATVAMFTCDLYAGVVPEFLWIYQKLLIR